MSPSSDGKNCRSGGQLKRKAVLSLQFLLSCNRELFCHFNCCFVLRESCCVEETDPAYETERYNLFALLESAAVVEVQIKLRSN